MSQTSTVQGVNQPTQIGLLAGTPGASAKEGMDYTNGRHARLINAVGGKRNRNIKKRLYGGDTNPNAITVGQYPMAYKPQSPPDSTPNAQIVNNALIGSQSRANAENDSAALNPTPQPSAQQPTIVKQGGSKMRKKTSTKTNKKVNKKTKKNKKVNKNTKKNKKANNFLFGFY